MFNFADYELFRLLGYIMEANEKYLYSDDYSYFDADTQTTITIPKGEVAFQKAVENTLSQGGVISQGSGWEFLRMESGGDEGLETVIYKNTQTNQVLLFSSAHTSFDAVESGEDYKYSISPIKSDYVPVTAFQLVKLYKQIEQENPGSSIVLAGHSMGAEIAKIAGAILQSENNYYYNNVEVVSYGGAGVAHLLNNMGLTYNANNIVNFYNSFDLTTLPYGGAIDNFGMTYYVPPSDTATSATEPDINHSLAMLGVLEAPRLSTTLSGTAEQNQIIHDLQMANLAFINQQDQDYNIDNSSIYSSSPAINPDGDNIVVGHNHFQFNSSVAGSDNTQYHDVLFGFGGNDILFGDKGNDTLIGGTGNDTYYGSLGEDTYVYHLGEGQDTLRNTFGSNDTLSLEGEGTELFTRDKVYLSEKNTIVVNADGSSFVRQDLRVNINNSADYITVERQFESETDTLGIEHIVADDGEILLGNTLNNVMQGTSSDDVMYAFSGNDTVIAGEGNDLVYGGNQDDSMYGELGNDTLNGETGDDLLIGGVGNDLLSGGEGNDVYLFNLGDGMDIINDNQSQLIPGGSDTLKFGPGITKDHLAFVENGNDLEILINNTADGVRIIDQLNPDNSSNRIEKILFEDDPGLMLVLGTSGNDYFDGSYEISEVVYGFEGNDRINGIFYGQAMQQVADTLHGGAGNDFIVGTVGEFFGGTGNDYLSAQSAYETQATLHGGSGNDVVLAAQNSSLYGDEGDDLLRGEGNNTLSGGSGNDILLGASEYYLGLAGATFGTLTDDGFSLTLDPLAAAYNPAPVYYDNISPIPASSNQMDGGTGNDTLIGGVANDHLQGGEGNDTLFAFQGETYMHRYEVIDMGNGMQQYNLLSTDVYNDLRNNLLDGGAGADKLVGSVGNDTLQGGTGKDTLYGGAGNDLYLFHLGDGQDILIEGNMTVSHYQWIAEGDNSLGAGMDTLRFGPGIDPNEVVFSVNGPDLVAKVIGTSDQVTLRGYFYPNQEGKRIERIEFFDGTVLTYPDLAHLAPTDFIYTGTVLAETIEGTSLDEAFHSAEGDDSIFADAGNDTLEGGAGNDTLQGGLGDDVFLFQRGDGQDVLQDTEFFAGNDTLRLVGDITLSDLSFGIENQDLIITLNGTSDRIVVQNQFYPGFGDRRLDQIEFSNGTVITAAEIEASVQNTIVGTEEDDTLMGTAFRDVISGLGGQDFISGGTGNDTLSGGAGNDTMLGGEGSDTYLFNRGDGQDLISDGSRNAANSSNDTLRFGNNITRDDITFIESGGNLIIALNNTNERITINGQLSGSLRQRIERFEFSDGTVFTFMDVQDQLEVHGTENDDVVNALSFNEKVLGFAGDDVLYGGEGNDTLNGGVGNDSLDGGNGDDTYQFENAWGTDTITADDSGIDTVDFSRVSLDLTINLGDDTFGDKVTDGINTLNWAGEMIENAIGGSGHDNITGNAVDNLLSGGAGNDTLSGQLGNDVYLFGYGNGVDTILETGGIDTVWFGEGITQDDLSFSKYVSSSGESYLKIVLNGTSDILYIRNQLESDANQQVDSFAFEDGTTLTADQVGALIITGIQGGAGADDLTGTAGDDQMFGNDGNDILSGQTGNDLLNGGTGNDSLIGGEGNDTLISGPGIDTLLGGLGNDTYIIENSTVFIAENPNEGIDTVYASVDYNLGADLENLVLTGSNAINGLGNSLNNLIIGNDNNNVLNGGVGNDTLQGGAGNDTYRIGWDIGDSVIADFGDDAQKVGHLIKQWTKYVNANLNTGHDVISDSSGSDTLDFSGRISGLNVNLNQTSVQFQSHSGQYANSIQWNSGSIENVSGSLGNDIITGNAADNVLSGGFGDDYLHGSSGNDTLLGGLGKDTLLGGLGNDLLSGGTGGDIYRFGKGDGMDIVYDNTAMNGSPDTLQLNSTISREEIAIFMDNGNLEIGYLGSATDKITIQNQNTTAGAIERIQLSNGNYMTDADINQVISQMSAYAANQGISLTSLNDVKNNQELMAMINAAWHA